MPITPDPCEALENAIAAKLAPLERWRLQLFADDYERSNVARASETLFVGHSSTEYVVVEDMPVIQLKETATFLIQLTSTDLRSHQKCMKYMRKAIEAISRYQPFPLIKPIIPVRYGDPRLTDAGLWVYTGTVKASWVNGPSEKPLEPFPAIEVDSISVGMYIGPSGELFKRNVYPVGAEE